MEAILVKANEIDKNETKGKVAKILSGAKLVYLGTNGSHGHPNIRAMSPAQVVGTETVWFVTDFESSKIAELAQDNKAVLYAAAPRNAGECRLWGHIDILDDPESRKLVWKDEFKEFFFEEGIDSPRLRVLLFHVSNGVLYGKNGKIGEFNN
jgi:general stress protein 26